MELNAWWETSLFVLLLLVMPTSALAGLYGIWELVRIAKRKSRPTSHGPIVHRRAHPGAPRIHALESSGDDAWVEARPDGSVVFGAGFPVLNLETLPTPFPVEGTARPTPDGWMVTGRLPLGPVLFIIGWMVSWLIGMILTAAPLQVRAAFLLAGWGAAGGAFWFCVGAESTRFRKVVDRLFPADNAGDVTNSSA